MWFILDPYRKVDPVTVNKFVQKVSITSKDNDRVVHLMLYVGTYIFLHISLGWLIYVEALLDRGVQRFAHCKEDSNYVFPDIKLCGLVPNLNIHTIMSDLYIPRIGPPINTVGRRSWEYIRVVNRSQYMNVEIRTEAAQFPFWEYFFSPILVL